MTDFVVGSEFAGCEIEAVAGRGGMGVVYRARQLELDRLVAIKAIAPWLAADTAYRERFQREARLAASIDHPNIIPVYAAGDSGGTLYLIMRWVDGVDLRTLIEREGRLSPSRALELLAPVASALGAAHRRGLVHRDVKPANVLIAVDGEREHVYLTDFGIARRTDATSAVTRTGVMVGSLDYMAPERIHGEAGGPPADIYAFGCLLYEALTARVPFPGDTELAKLHAHVNEPPPSPGRGNPGVSTGLEAVVRTAMAKDPANRYASAGALSTALVAAVGGTGAETVASGPPTGAETVANAPLTGETDAMPRIAAPRSTTTRPTPRPALAPDADHAGRRRQRAIAGAAAAVIVVLGLVIFTFGTGKETNAQPQKDAAVVTPRKPAKVAALRKPVLVSLGAGSAPDGLYYDGGRVWAAESGAGAVAAIDVQTRRPSGRPIKVGADPDSITGDETSLWVTNTGSDTVSVLPTGGGARRDLTVGRRPEGVALGFGSAWIANSGDGTVSRVDLDTKRVAPPITVGRGPVFVLVAYGSVWTADSESNTVTRIDPASNRVRAIIPVGRRPRALAAQDGLWVANGYSGTVSRIDPRRQGVRHTTRAFARNLKGMIGDARHGVVWVSDVTGKRLWRVTTRSGRSDRVLPPKAMLAAPWSLARTDDGIWASDTTGTGVVAIPDP